MYSTTTRLPWKVIYSHRLFLRGLNSVFKSTAAGHIDVFQTASLLFVITLFIYCLQMFSNSQATCH